jgi:hypothetical protein
MTYKIAEEISMDSLSLNGYMMKGIFSITSALMKNLFGLNGIYWNLYSQLLSHSTLNGPSKLYSPPLHQFSRVSQLKSRYILSLRKPHQLTSSTRLLRFWFRTRLLINHSRISFISQSSRSQLRKAF